MAKVVFLLGAGASAHLQFPTGAELHRRILEDHKSSVEVRELLHAQFDSNKVEDFYKRLRDIDVDSIDEFLSVQVDEELQSIGRFLIAYCIGHAEHRSLSASVNPSSDWYKIFKRYLFYRPQLVDAARFSFITFNYDRSLENYLSRSLRADPRFSADKITTLLGPKNFLHLHGSLGEIVETDSSEKFEYGSMDPLSGRDAGGGVLRFDKTRLQEGLRRISRASSGLFLTHAKISREQEVRALLADASHMVILGFGFHKSNCEKALIHEFAAESRLILATKRELSPAAEAYVSGLKNFKAFKMNANTLFSEHLVKLMDEVF